VHARPNLERATLASYSTVWDRHVLPRLGMYRIQEITPEVVSNFQADLHEAGVGTAMTRKAMFLLQSVMGSPRCGA
jgi:integrase